MSMPFACTVGIRALPPGSGSRHRCLAATESMVPPAAALGQRHQGIGGTGRASHGKAPRSLCARRVSARAERPSDLVDPGQGAGAGSWSGGLGLRRAGARSVWGAWAVLGGGGLGGGEEGGQVGSVAGQAGQALEVAGLTVSAVEVRSCSAAARMAPCQRCRSDDSKLSVWLWVSVIVVLLSWCWPGRWR